MSIRSNGSYIGPRPAGPSSSVASGIWDLRTAERQKRAAAWPGDPVDEYFSSVSLLMHMDGSGATFTDSSGTPKTITANGNATQSTTQSKFGGKSAYFDGTGDYLSSPSNAAFDFSDGDFTIEFWFNAATVATSFQGFLGRRATPANFGPFSMGLAGTSVLFSLSTTGSSWALNSTGGTVSASTWYHVAFVRSGTACVAYLDGTSIISGTVSGSLASSTQTLAIGSFTSDGQDSFNGYIDDLRITKGVARYTANFTPPTAPFPDA